MFVVRRGIFGTHLSNILFECLCVNACTYLSIWLQKFYSKRAITWFLSPTIFLCKKCIASLVPVDPIRRHRTGTISPDIDLLTDGINPLPDQYWLISSDHLQPKNKFRETEYLGILSTYLHRSHHGLYPMLPAIWGKQPVISECVSFLVVDVESDSAFTMFTAAK